MAGRPADPTRARRGTGNRPLAGEKPPTEVAVVAVPDERGALRRMFPPPVTVYGDALNLWDSLVAELAPRGLRPADLMAVQILVEAAMVHADASKDIVANGLFDIGPSGAKVANPAVKIQKDAAATFLRYSESFGLTLASRLRLGLMQLAGETMLQGLSRDLDEAVARELGR